MQSDIVDLIERVRRRLGDIERRCVIAGPVPEDAVVAAEQELGASFPPSYREFLRHYGALGIPADLAVVHDFCGLADEPGGDVVRSTLAARDTYQLADHLIVVGKGANAAEWFCLDTGRAQDSGECPVVLFDPAANEIDQIFYDDFGAMVREVLEFVDDTLRGDGAPRD
ncbi:MAG: SMI1/KNR4 family protein [Myxococcales bacterium]|nr:SMI1/KNR4 family protein [Myxococcales bacterium]